jgi:hypothetical protein
VFSRIRDHEEIAERGEDPVAVLKARKTGTYEDEDGNAVSAGGKQPEGDEGNGDFDEEAMIEGRLACSPLICISDAAVGVYPDYMPR